MESALSAVKPACSQSDERIGCMSSQSGCSQAKTANGREQGVGHGLCGRSPPAGWNPKSNFHTKCNLRVMVFMNNVNESYQMYRNHQSSSPRLSILIVVL